MASFAERFGREISNFARTCGVPAAAIYVAAIARSAREIMRTRTLVAADRRMHGRAWTYTVDGTTFDLDGRYFSGAREMYCRAVYFAPGARMQLRPGDTVIDLGANAGLFTLLAALKCRRVIALEAQTNFSREIETLARDHGVADKVHVETALIGAETGVFARHEALLSATHSAGVTPPTTTMEALLAKYDIQQVDFLKADIEGSEFSVIRGQEPWLSKVQRIAMEVHARFGDPHVIARVLRDAGFEVQLRDNDLRIRDRLNGDGYLYAWRNRAGG